LRTDEYIIEVNWSRMISFEALEYFEIGILNRLNHKSFYVYKQ
jgi:hypothetical protein